MPERFLIDEELELSGPVTLEQLNEDVFQSECLDRPAFPTTYQLAQFANAVYEDNPGEYQLPEDWEVWIIAKNSAFDNGYFGVGFLNKKLQLVTIAHRGTKLTSLGAISTDISGVVLNNYTSQSNSAVTFVDKVRAEICRVNKKFKMRYRLSITGHSLGAWLGQITTLSALYIDCKTRNLLKDPKDGILVHTEVFDSPGVRPMLHKIQEDHEKQFDGKINLKRLDMKNYFIAPNAINANAAHVGEGYQLDGEREQSKGNAITNLFVHPNYKEHKMDKFQNSLKMRKLKNWPRDEIDREDFYKLQKDQATYQPKQSHPTILSTYESEEYSGNTCSLNVFEDNEKFFINFLNICNEENTKQLPEFNEFLDKKGLHLDDFFPILNSEGYYIIDKIKYTITCPDKDKLIELVNRTKQLFRWFPEDLQEVMNNMKKRSPNMVFRVLDWNYRSLMQSLPACEDTLGIQVFLDSTQQSVLALRTNDILFHGSRILYTSDFKSNDRFVFLAYKDLESMAEFIQVKDVFGDETNKPNCVLIVDCSSLPENCTENNMLSEILQCFENSPKKKIILLVYEKIELPQIKRFSENRHQKLELNDFTKESRKHLLNKEVISISKEKISFNQLFGNLLDNDVKLTMLSGDLLKKLATKDDTIITIESCCPNLIDSNVMHSRVQKIMTEKGLKSAEEEVVLEKGEETQFSQKCHERPDKIVYWINDNTLKQVYNSMFYIKRKIHNRYVVNLEELRKHKTRDTFIIRDADNKESLIDVLELSEEQGKSLFKMSSQEASQMINSFALTENNSKLFDDCSLYKILPAIAASVENVSVPHVHLLSLEGSQLVWNSSEGGLDRLRPYVHLDNSKFIDEAEFIRLKKKVVIIAGEPGAGKSTVLRSLGDQIKQSAFVLYLRLGDCKDEIAKLPHKPKLQSIIYFLTNQNDKTTMEETKLLKLFMRSENSRPVFILLDEFDRIKEDRNSKNAKKILYLLNVLKEKTANNTKIIITTRMHTKETLEEGLSEFAVTLQDIQESQAKEFFEEFWRSHLLPVRKEILDGRVKDLVNAVGNMYRLPLQMRMLAETYMPQSKSSKESTIKSDPKCDFFSKYINQKIQIHNNIANNLSFGTTLEERLLENHRLLACKALGIDNVDRILDSTKKEELDEMVHFGLVQKNQLGDIQFSHHTIAEYFCADTIVLWLTCKRLDQFFPLSEKDVVNIFTSPSFKNVRTFINNRLKDYKDFERGKINKELMEFDRDIIEQALEVSMEENNDSLTAFLNIVTEITSKNEIKCDENFTYPGKVVLEDLLNDPEGHLLVFK